MMTHAIPDLAANTTPMSSRHQQLQKAATQFEAVMLNELMKPLAGRSTFGEDEADVSGGSLQSYGVEAMAGALARSGALGFAASMVRSVEAHEAKNASDNSQKTAHAERSSADRTDREIWV